MLVHLLKNALRVRAGNPARAALREALSAYLAGDLPGSVAHAEAALRLEPRSGDAWYWLGAFRLARADGADTAAAGALECFERALALSPAHQAYLGGLGDALLLSKRESEALTAYSRAFGAHVPADPPDATPALRAHPVWLRHISTVVPPRPRDDYLAPPVLPPLRMAHVAAGHAANYAALLANNSRITGAVRFFRHALAEAPEQCFPHAALALIHTLNGSAAEAIPHALAARAAGVELLSDGNDLCLLDAALRRGQQPGELDAFLDWSLLESESPQRAIERLPAVDGRAFGQANTCALTCFVACDLAYFLEHAIALVLSIRERCTDTAVHLHFFAPEAEAREPFESLRRRAAPLPMQASYEDVPFENYGGRQRYCAHARLCRLYQWVAFNERPVAMLDADCLVRADLRPALRDRGDIALVVAPEEPIWHRVLCGFSAYRPSAGSRRFLARVGGIAAHNLSRGRAPYSMDQTLLHVCSRLLEEEAGPVERLPLEFCDTTFQAGSLVWAVTQDKAAEPFRHLKARLLAVL